jgi:PilZ domain/SPOR domain
MLQERRQFQRLVPDSPPSVSLGDSWRGRLFDLSEGGLGVAGLPPKSRNQVISVAFDLPGGNGHVRAQAEIAWTSESEHRTGLRFLGLADNSRQQLKEWISSRVYSAALAASGMQDVPPDISTDVFGFPVSPRSHNGGDVGLAHLTDSQFPIHRTTGLIVKKQELMTHEGLRRLTKLRHPVGQILALVILAPVSVFLGYLLGNRGNYPQATNITPITIAAPSSPDGSSTTIKPPPAVTPTLPSTLPFDLPGFVLQVGAMTHEDNADILRESLEEKNFPAFVFKRSTGRFYRVAVGPYSDADSAVRIKDQLEGEGFEAIIRRWSPE